MRIPQWLRTYWIEQLWPALGQCDGTAEQYQQVFEQTMRDWEQLSSELTNRPYTDRTIGRYLTETRNWIETLPQLEASENRSRSRHIELAEAESILAVFNKPSEWWAALMDHSRDTVDQRNRHQALLPNPEAIVARIRELLSSQDWAPLAVGLAGAMGRRIGEVLHSGSVEPKSAYTVLFRGRLKRRGAPEEAFEIPTLCEAALVLDAWQRLRSHPDILAMNLPLPQDAAKQKQALEIINQQLYPTVRRAANYYFQELVPPIEDEEGQERDLYAHLFRSIYRTVAIWYYCPIHVDPDTFSATILGHSYYQQLKTKKERLNFASEHFYRIFAISDGSGNVDGRRGLHLPEGLIEAFRKEYEMQVVQSGASRPKTRKAKATEPRVSKTGYSSLKPKSATRAWFDQVADELELTWKGTDATLRRLLEIYEAHKLCENGGQLAPERVTPQQLALSGDLIARIDQAMPVSGQDSFAAFLVHALERESNVQIGLAGSRKKRESEDVSRLPWSKIKGSRRREESLERIRRAIGRIIDFNRTCSDPNGYWYINVNLLRDYIGASPTFISPVLKANAELIARHHEHFRITPGHNQTPTHKATPIGNDPALAIPEDPAEIKSLSDIVLPSLSTDGGQVPEDAAHHD